MLRLKYAVFQFTSHFVGPPKFDSNTADFDVHAQRLM
jgi:hypothetical protein